MYIKCRDCGDSGHLDENRYCHCQAGKEVRLKVGWLKTAPQSNYDKLQENIVEITVQINGKEVKKQIETKSHQDGWRNPVNWRYYKANKDILVDLALMTVDRDWFNELMTNGGND